MRSFITVTLIGCLLVCMSPHILGEPASASEPTDEIPPLSMVDESSSSLDAQPAVELPKGTNGPLLMPLSKEVEAFFAAHKRGMELMPRNPAEDERSSGDELSFLDAPMENKEKLHAKPIPVSVSAENDIIKSLNAAADSANERLSALSLTEDASAPEELKSLMTAEQIRTALSELTAQFAADPNTPVAPETRTLINSLQVQLQKALVQVNNIINPVRDLSPEEKKAIMFKVHSEPFIGDPQGMHAKDAAAMIREFKGKQSVRKIAKSEIDGSLPVYPIPADKEIEAAKKNIALSGVFKPAAL